MDMNKLRAIYESRIYVAESNLAEEKEKNKILKARLDHLLYIINTNENQCVHEREREKINQNVNASLQQLETKLKINVSNQEKLATSVKSIKNEVEKYIEDIKEIQEELKNREDFQEDTSIDAEVEMQEISLKNREDLQEDISIDAEVEIQEISICSLVQELQDEKKNSYANLIKNVFVECCTYFKNIPIHHFVLNEVVSFCLNGLK
ncbi:uncharacterized protein LOC119690282 isoform X2 [Teleopsis dalmanni]|uniref:uncharacterized protein LOC119690282 isoform X2 n=1 Tax=Teleopsis dalmanni TaxID=139649 RepID=UPI0018CFDFB7|nr:uncharacterized protein LOC119690282 isoform X2 [Teleopsis dalmanni]